MSKDTFREARDRTKSYIRYQGIPHHMYYAPTTDRYWATPTRIVFANLESYGYQDCHCFDVDKEMLNEWFNDVGETGTRTVKYASDVCATLLYVIEASAQTSDIELKAMLRTNYLDVDLLTNTLDKICYWNIRPTSNPKTNLDKKAVLDFASSKLASYVIAEFYAWDPNIVIISGEVGVRALKKMKIIPDDISYLDTKKIGDVIYMSICHTSRPNYAAWTAAIRDCFQKRATVAEVAQITETNSTPTPLPYDEAAMELVLDAQPTEDHRPVQVRPIAPRPPEA